MTPSAEAPHVLWTIWGAMLVTLLASAIVGAALQLPVTPSPDLLPLLMPILGATALFHLAFVAVAPRLFANRLTFTAYCTLRWALCEAVGLLGLVLRFLGAPLDVMGAFVGAAAVALIVTRPTSGARERFEAAT